MESCIHISYNIYIVFQCHQQPLSSLRCISCNVFLVYMTSLKCSTQAWQNLLFNNCTVQATVLHPISCSHLDPLYADLIENAIIFSVRCCCYLGKALNRLRKQELPCWSASPNTLALILMLLLASPHFVFISLRVLLRYILAIHHSSLAEMSHFNVRLTSMTRWGQFCWTGWLRFTSSSR